MEIRLKDANHEVDVIVIGGGNSGFAGGNWRVVYDGVNDIKSYAMRLHDANYGRSPELIFLSKALTKTKSTSLWENVAWKKTTVS